MEMVNEGQKFLQHSNGVMCDKTKKKNQTEKHGEYRKDFNVNS